MHQAALVRWVCPNKPEDDGTYSVIDSAWVMNFEPDSWKNEDENEMTWVVELRDKKKKPARGWNCYDAFILDVGEKKMLEKKLDDLLKKLNKPGSSSNLSPEAEKDKDPAISGDERTNDESGDCPSCKILRQENDHYKSLLVKEIPDVLKAAKKLVEIQKRPAREKQVELYPSTNVFIPASEKAAAEACTTAGTYAGRLLMALFPVDVLLKSNLTGGKAKTGGDPTTPRKDPLDPIKLNALIKATQTKFPGTSKSVIGISITNKIGNLRHQRSAQNKGQQSSKGTPNKSHSSQGEDSQSKASSSVSVSASSRGGEGSSSEEEDGANDSDSSSAALTQFLKLKRH